MRHLKYTCPKCGNKQYEIGEIRVTGSLLAKIFDVQNKKYSSVTCSRCTYTEFYKANSSTLANVFDLFVG
ncbi:MAG TPA: zinc ribbon domain-containing protein [Bacteroidales bacterium]|jgi:predicted nucleic-acid-binding Zn-ribbon protein|nr:zinc ribbon domain-containing protein [Bacteroidales bacterium]MDD4086021.1 zinc ribbon domain-containing protein [Bacteroidales bacterium]MDY0085470.1 zinc ribbon domain-containing protein [Bacteroidales bacterium]HPE42912.1 zinc ribbon domain-containing protein [Bacteroidales bacterium]